MIKHFCDICGREIQEDNIVKVNVKYFDLAPVDVSLDLCMSCYSLKTITLRLAVKSKGDIK